jgi:hypothetical protein
LHERAGGEARGAACASIRDKVLAALRPDGPAILDGVAGGYRG